MGSNCVGCTGHKVRLETILFLPHGVVEMQAVIRHPQICSHVYKRKQILKAPRSQRLLGHSSRVHRGPCAPGSLVPLFSVAVFSYFEVINYFSSVHYFACVPVFISFTYIHFAPPPVYSPQCAPGERYWRV